MNKIVVPTVLISLIAAVIVFGSMSPTMAYSQGETQSYKRHWTISIGTASGSLEITENTDKNELKKSIVPLDSISADYSDIQKAHLSTVVNDDGKYFLVWKLVSFNHNTETDTKIKTIYVIDAGTGEPLTDPITKEGGSCGGKDKSQTTKDNA
jgi:hypothetical protein